MMLYIHRLLRMNIFSIMVLTATLALSASLSLVGLESVRAGTKMLVDGSYAPQVEKTPSFAVRSTMIAVFIDPLQTSFEPEPNDPPSRTGGSGTR